jgi:hypothetical protein
MGLSGFLLPSNSVQNTFGSFFGYDFRTLIGLLFAERLSAELAIPVTPACQTSLALFAEFT